MSVKLTIANTKREIEREEELHSILTNCMRGESYLQSQQGDVMNEKVNKNVNDNSFSGDATIEKESEEGQEIARLKESILLADCLINKQKKRTQSEQ